MCQNSVFNLMNSCNRFCHLGTYFREVHYQLFQSKILTFVSMKKSPRAQTIQPIVMRRMMNPMK